LNVTVSRAVSTSSTVTSNRSASLSMTPWTRSSGAEAPAVTPTLATLYDLTIEEVAPTRETVTFKLPRVLTG
ncbi:MAG: hypothetical protein HY859_10185, partial [Caulobacterales bacterium]|nr:hypothetical protein [Caulobacterales bacterium]